MKPLRGLLAILVLGAARAPAQDVRVNRPFGTLREQAEMQQRWLERRMDVVLPSVMRRHGVDFWVVPMREYNEDPVFTSMVSPTTFAARRRTIYVFDDRCSRLSAVGSRPQDNRTPSTESREPCRVDRIALGGTSQGGVFQAVRSALPAAGPAGAQTARQAELWGDEQWQVLRRLVDERQPRAVAVNVSRTFAFSDGLSAGELEGMKAALGPSWSAKLKPIDGLALDLIATRLPEEETVFRRMNELVWGIIDTAFSSLVITPGVTRTQDVVWWMRQRVNDLGLGSWFQPSVDVQRMGATAGQLGDNPVIERGDVLHCDFGIVAFRLNTDTQHMATCFAWAKRTCRRASSGPSSDPTRSRTS